MLLQRNLLLLARHRFVGVLQLVFELLDVLLLELELYGPLELLYLVLQPLLVRLQQLPVPDELFLRQCQLVYLLPLA